MDIVCSIPDSKFDALRLGYKRAAGDKGTLDLPCFCWVVRQFINPPPVDPLPPPPGILSASERMEQSVRTRHRSTEERSAEEKRRRQQQHRPLSPMSRRLHQAFQHIDFKDSKRVSWEQFSMYLVDAVAKGSSAGGAQSATRLDSYELGPVHAQSPPGRVRVVKYVPAWDRVVRGTSFNGQHGVEIANPTTHTVITAAPTQRPAIVSIEAVPKGNVVVTANADITASFYRITQQNNIFSKPTLVLERVASQKEIDTSVMCFKWHSRLERLYSGMQDGRVIPWNLNVERAAVAERYKPCLHEAMAVHSAPIMCMLPLEDKLVTASLDRTIAVVNPERALVDEVLHGHVQGVLSVTNSDYANLLVSGGFESALFAWNLAVKERVKPWKLVDQSNPHRGDVVFVHAPSGTPQIVSADNRGIVKLWDMRNFQCIQTLQPDRFYAAADLAGASVTKTLLVPTAHRPRSVAAASAKAETAGRTADEGALPQREAHPFSATYNSTSKVLLLTGSRATYHLASDQPVDLASSDDFPVTVSLFNQAMGCFLTAHNRTVKIWDATTGAVIDTYAHIVDSEITAACLDHSGRKFFLGTRKGVITGHIFLGGTKYRTFTEDHDDLNAVIELQYLHVRANRRLLFAACAHEHFSSFEDNDADTKQLVITQPVHLLGALLQIDFDAATSKASAVHKGSIVRARSDNSMRRQSSRRRSLGGSVTFKGEHSGSAYDSIADQFVSDDDDDDGDRESSPSSPFDGASMLVRSCVMSNADVQALLHIGDGTDHVVPPPSKPPAKRLSAAANTHKVHNLNRAEEQITKHIPKATKFDFTLMRFQRRLSLIYVAVRNVVAVIDCLQLLTVHVFVFENDVTVVTPLGDLPCFTAIDSANVLYAYSVRPSRNSEQLILAHRLNLQPSDSSRAHVASSADYHASQQTLVIGDNLGYISMWDLKPFIRLAKLTPSIFPSVAISATVLRRKVTYPSPDESSRVVQRLWGPTEAHADEVTQINFITNTAGAPAFLTACWGDHRVRFWKLTGEDAGELSQGRLQRPENTDRDTVALHYRRHGVKPFLLSGITFEEQPIDVEDLPEIVVILLRKAARRYLNRKFLRDERKSFVIGRGKSFAEFNAENQRRRASFAAIERIGSFSTSVAGGGIGTTDSASASPVSSPKAGEAPRASAAAQGVSSPPPDKRQWTAPPSTDRQAAEDGLPGSPANGDGELDDDGGDDPEALFASLRERSTMSEWTAATNLDRAKGTDTEAVRVPDVTKPATKVTHRPAKITFLAPAKIDLSTRKGRRGPNARLGIGAGRQRENLAGSPNHDSALLVPQNPEGAGGTIATQGAQGHFPPVRPELHLSEPSMVLERERQLQQRERYVAERCHLQPTSMGNLHRAMDTYKASAGIGTELGREGRQVHRESVKSSGVPTLPKLPTAKLHTTHPHTARGTMVPRGAPIGHRRAEIEAAKNLFADEPRPAPSSNFASMPSSRSHSSVTATTSRTGDPYSTSRYNAGSYTPMFRTDA